MRANLQAEREKAEMTAAHNELVLQAQLKRDGLSLQSTLDKLQKQAIVEVEALNRRHEEERLHQKALHDLQLQLLDAQSQATVAERQAIQPALVEALSGLGDKILLGEVAANMNLVSLFKGKDVATLFSDILGGTKVGQTIAAMMPDKKDKKLPPPRGAREDSRLGGGRRRLLDLHVGDPRLVPLAAQKEPRLRARRHQGAGAPRIHPQRPGQRRRLVHRRETTVDRRQPLALLRHRQLRGLAPREPHPLVR
jgi:hypothetical protein